MLGALAARTAARIAGATSAVAARAVVGAQPRRFYQAPQKDMDFVVNETYAQWLPFTLLILFFIHTLTRGHQQRPSHSFLWYFFSLVFRTFHDL